MAKSIWWGAALGLASAVPVARGVELTLEVTGLPRAPVFVAVHASADGWLQDGRAPQH